MNFLLECIGFLPEDDPESLAQIAMREGEGAPWRGDPARHRRLDLGGGLELRADREEGQDFWTVLPHYQVPHRLRVAVERLKIVPDSPFDALLSGWACPPPHGDMTDAPGAYRLATWLSDARRLPRSMPVGHVLAVSVAGFALDVTYVGPNDGVRDAAILEREGGAFVAPLGEGDDPGGCCDVSLRVREIRHLRNRITGRAVDVLVCDAPERPLTLFTSPFQLVQDGFEAPRPSWRIEGTFLFTGHVSGGLRGPRRKAGHTFG